MVASVITLRNAMEYLLKDRADRGEPEDTDALHMIAGGIQVICEIEAGQAHAFERSRRCRTR
jgi:hypothetical protein